MSKNPYRVILGFDMETDLGSYTCAYRGVQDATPLLLNLLEKKGVPATFYFTGEAAMKNPLIVKMAIREGHEVGAHSLFHETLGDEIIEIPGTKSILPEEVPIRIRKCTEWVAEATGIKPVSFRCPRLWGSTAVVNFLEMSGYTTDASYPVYYHRKQLFPYHPSHKNWLEAGDLKLLEIPNYADLLMQSSDPPIERDRDPWHVYRCFGADTHYKYIANFLKMLQSEKRIPVVCFYLHPWEFLEMPGIVDTGECRIALHEFIYRNTGEAALRELAALIDILKGDGAEFIHANTAALHY